MTTTHTSHNIIRVGILAPVKENGGIDICDRWGKPFEKAGMDIEYIPADAENLDEILGRIHGLLLPGGDSNIHPFFYEPQSHAEPKSDEERRDLQRDRTATELARKAFELDIPTLGICRGMQEMVVAFGGALETLDTHINHAKGYDAPVINGRRCQKAMDKLVHDIEIIPGGKLDEFFNDKMFMVNSIHKQGITKEFWNAPRNTRLRDVFMIEAVAPDGVVEAISVKPEHQKRFFVGLQAHFELPGRLHVSMFTPFRRAIRDYQQSVLPISDPVQPEPEVA